MQLCFRNRVLIQLFCFKKLMVFKKLVLEMAVNCTPSFGDCPRLGRFVFVAEQLVSYPSVLGCW